MVRNHALWRMSLKGRWYFNLVVLCLLSTSVYQTSSAGINSPFGSSPPYPWLGLLPGLDRIIQRIVQQPFDAPDLNAGVLKVYLALPEHSKIYKNNKKVQKISMFMCSPDPRKTEGIEKKGFLLLHFSSGGAALFMLSLDDVCYVSDLWGAMFLCGMIVDPLFDGTDDVRYICSQEEVLRQISSISHFSSFNDLSKYSKEIQQVLQGRNLVPSEALYSPLEIQFYEWLHRQIALLLYQHLANQPEVLSRARQFGVYLFALGCGSGDDLNESQQYLQKKGIDVTACGIELRKELVEKGRDKYKEITFIQADALKATRLFSDIRRKYPRHQSAPTLVIAEGLINRGILEPNQALLLMQRLQREKKTELMVIGGKSIPLVNDEIISATHWDGNAVMIAVPEELQAVSALYIPAFVLRQQGKKAQVEGVKQRSKQRSRDHIFTTIDLNMSSDPVGMIDALLDDQKVSQKIAQIDLSYSYLTPEELKPLTHRFIGFPNLRRVLISNYERWNEAFSQAMMESSRYGLLKRMDNKYFHELPVFPPWLARLFKQYDRMPSEQIYKPEKVIPANSLSTQSWADDISVSGLPEELLAAYHSSLTDFLSSLHIQLVSTAADNACFYHAVADQLGMPHQVLIQSLTNQLLHNQQAIQQQFPSLAGDQFDLMLGEMQDNAWAEPRVLQVISFLLNKRAVLFYYNRITGEPRILVFMPDGAVLSYIPDNLVYSNDLVVVHNGQQHFLGGTLNGTHPDLQAHNRTLLGGSRAEAETVLSDKTGISFPVMTLLLITSWNKKFRS